MHERASKLHLRRTLAEQLADALKEAILAGRWTAGEALPPEAEAAMRTTRVGEIADIPLSLDARGRRML